MRARLNVLTLAIALPVATAAHAGRTCESQPLDVHTVRQSMELADRTAFGDAPWSELSQVGTPFDLRAYRWGQIRDRTGFTAVLEYRFMLPFDEKSLWSHLGVAAWGGVGAMSPTPLPDFTRVLPSVGAGLRVELLQRVTLRLDVGFGRNSRAVYFNFLEAF